MRALIQRVSDASVTVDGRLTGQIGPGLLVLVCAMQGDDAGTAEKLAARVAKLRIFRDEDAPGLFNSASPFSRTDWRGAFPARPFPRRSA